jgi:hypothetical protein
LLAVIYAGVFASAEFPRAFPGRAGSLRPAASIQMQLISKSQKSAIAGKMPACYA